MKTLLALLTLLSFNAFGASPWTHGVIEGEDGGINANYFFYDTFKPDYGDGTLMSIQRVRAIYAQNPESQGLPARENLTNNPYTFVADCGGKALRMKNTDDLVLQFN